jgi:hypothetical protein
MRFVCAVLFMCISMSSITFGMEREKEKKEIEILYVEDNEIPMDTMGSDAPSERQMLIRKPKYKKKICCGELNIYDIPDEQKRCIKIMACVSTTLTILAISALMFAAKIDSQLRPINSRCTVDVTQIPDCGTWTPSGINQDQSVFLNALGNVKRIALKGTPGNLEFAKNYCTQTSEHPALPARTVCTNFNVSQYPNLPDKCKKFQGGKLIGVVVPNREEQEKYFAHTPRNNCSRAVARVKRSFKASKTPYCEIDPHKVGFTIQNKKPLILWLALILANESVSTVDPKRWEYPESLNSIDGPIWGVGGNCYAIWTSNVDPSAQKNQQKTRQKLENSGKALKRQDNVIQKKYKTKLGNKTKSHR